MEIMATLIIEGRIHDVYRALVERTKKHLGILTRDPRVTDFIRSIESGVNSEIIFDDAEVEFRFQPGKGLLWKEIKLTKWTLVVPM